MIYKVLKDFRDKHTKQVYLIDEQFETDNAKRVAELQKKGFISKEEVAIFNTLSGTAPDIISGVTIRTEKYEVEALLKAEKKDKNRKTVVKHLEELLNSEE